MQSIRQRSTTPTARQVRQFLAGFNAARRLHEEREARLTRQAWRAGVTVATAREIIREAVA